MAGKAGMATGVEVARISVKVSPDTKQFRRDLKSDLDAIERSVTTKIDVEPNMAGFRRDVASQTKGMRTSVKVDADVDRSFFSRLTERLQGIKGPEFGSGVNGAGMAAILAGGFAVAAPLVGIVTSALLTLPGILAAVAAPIGAITAGLDGIKKAAERLKPPFESLKATMNAVNESAFGPVFDKLGDVFPSLERSLPKVSQGMADFAQGIVTAVTSPEGLAKIESTISNIGAAISRAAPGIGSFTSGLLTLADKFSEKMPDLSDWFNGAGDSFEKWIEKLTKPNWLGESTLDKAFDGLGGTLKTILDTLGGIATAGMEFFKDPAKINDFNNALKGVGDSLTRITELSSSLNNGNLFSSVLPTGFKLDGGFDIQSVIDDITKPFTSDNAGWRDMWAGMQTAWDETKTSFLASMSIVQTAASTAWSAVAGAVSNAVSSIQGAVSGIGAFISGIWSGIVAAAQGAWNGVVSVVQGAWNGVISAISSAVSTVISTVQNMGSQIVSAITSIDLSAAGAQIVQGLINGIGSMIGSAVAKARELASSVANAVTGFLGINSPSKLFTDYGAYTAEGFENGMLTGFEPVINQAKRVAEQITKAFDEGLDFSTADTDQLKKAIDEIELEKKRLKVEKNALGDDKDGKAGVQAMIDQLQAQKDILSYQKDRLKTEGNITAEASDNPMVDAASGLLSAPVDFAKATAGQFMSDLGISGDGMISKGITEGIQYLFQIGSVDEALSIKDREDSKRARASVGR